jgi:hypothetical protein
MKGGIHFTELLPKIVCATLATIYKELQGNRADDQTN